MLTPLPHTYSCFVCGEKNSAGLNLRFHTDGRIVETEFVPDQRHIGFKDTVHGGIVAALLDEVMVWATAIYSRRFAYCAELSVRFLQPIIPGVAVTARAELVENRRDRLFVAKGQILSVAGATMATGVGKYIPVKGDQYAEFAADFVTDPAPFFKLPD